MAVNEEDIMNITNKNGENIIIPEKNCNSVTSMKTNNFLIIPEKSCPVFSTGSLPSINGAHKCCDVSTTSCNAYLL